jgi:sensor domain CHASE-containing protein
MSFLGAQVSKVTYNFILWTIILGLLLLLLLFIYKFRRSNFLTQEAKANLSDLESEYEDHRRRALEREQRISRQLQDEINKYRKSK